MPATNIGNYYHPIPDNRVSLLGKYIFRLITVFMISPYGPKSFLFGTAQFSFEPGGTVNYDYIVTNSINSLAQHVFPMAHTLTLVEPIWPMLQNVSKTLTHPNNEHHQSKIIINSIIIINIIVSLVSMILLHNTY